MNADRATEDAVDAAEKVEDGKLDAAALKLQSRRALKAIAKLGAEDLEQMQALSVSDIISKTRAYIHDSSTLSNKAASDMTTALGTLDRLSKASGSAGRLVRTAVGRAKLQALAGSMSRVHDFTFFNIKGLIKNGGIKDISGMLKLMRDNPHWVRVLQQAAQLEDLPYQTTQAMMSGLDNTSHPSEFKAAFDELRESLPSESRDAFDQFVGKLKAAKEPIDFTNVDSFIKSMKSLFGQVTNASDILDGLNKNIYANSEKAMNDWAETAADEIIHDIR
jgi:hypothetical protein